MKHNMRARPTSTGAQPGLRVMPTSRPAIAERIERARIAAGFETPAAAAIVLAIPLGTYKNHETGVHTPKPYELHRYAEVFRVSYSWLASGLGQGPAI